MSPTDSKEQDERMALEQRALLLLQQNNLKAAEDIYIDLIKAGSKNPISYGNLAAIYWMTARPTEAIPLLHKALAIKPDYPEALSNLGLILYAQGNLDDAITTFERAISIQPNNLNAQFNLGLALKQQCNFEGAITALEKAIALQPNHPEALYNLANILKIQGKFERAVSTYQKALELNPNSAGMLSNLGIALHGQGNINAAIDSFQKAISIDPGFAQAHSNLGLALQLKGDHEAAITSYKNAISLQYNYPEAHTNLAMTLLLVGDYVRGWQEYEWRMRTTTVEELLNASPKGDLWKGEPLKTQEKLLVLSEQGFGDTLQFMRYLLSLKEQGVAVSFCAHPKLHGLIKASCIDDHPLSPEQANQLSGCKWIPLLSLPKHLGVNPAHPLITKPYLKTSEPLIRLWRSNLSLEKRPIIGINWQGNPNHEQTISQGRSLPLETFAPIAALPNIALLSLQKGFGSEQLNSCSFRDRFVSCQGQVDQAWDFLETAAIIANCDLVITSDTSVAHLAAGLGKTTWLLLMAIPEWRWGLEGDSSYWYPCMRLFRQQDPGDWAGVLQKVAAELQHWIHSNPSSKQFNASQSSIDSPPKRESSDLDTTNKETGHIDLEKEAQSLIKQAKYNEAESIYQRLIADGNNNPIIYSNLAAICHLEGRTPEMISLLRQALALKPDFPEALSNLGIALQEQGNLNAAIDSFRKALALDPNLSQAHSSLGLALQIIGDYEAAIKSYKQAISLQPDYTEAHTNLAITLLLLGDYDRGWQEYEWRVKSQTAQSLFITCPKVERWDGEFLEPNTRLLVLSEQGYGDTLQFMRYLLPLRQQGFAVSLCAHPNLHTLIKASGIDPDPLSPEQAREVSNGHWIPLLSLPKHLGVNPDNPIITEPYLKTSEQLVSKWCGILSTEKRPIIGINWQGNPDHEKTNSQGRSFSLDTFAPLAELPSIALLSLQKGIGSEQLETCSFGDRFVSCQNLVNQTWDFLETAAIIANCDLVITSDTSVAHLAAGLGKTTWLLLKSIPEWRWGLSGETSFWYPSMRLFRQHERGNWTEVIERVAFGLQHYLEANDKSKLLPEPGEATTHNDQRNFDLSQLKIFAINLPDAMERRSRLIAMEETHGLDLEIINGVDGRSVTRAEIQKRTHLNIQWESLNGHRDEIRKPTEAACCISHISIWQQIINENLDVAIIIEDDVELLKGMKFSTSANAEFVFLANRASHNTKGEVHGPVCGSEAYLVTRECCQKLLKIFSTIRMPVDIQWLPQMRGLIESNYFITSLHDPALPIIEAHVKSGVFRLTEFSKISQIR
jgi:tetratricopeptide (TPR) repeat protein